MNRKDAGILAMYRASDGPPVKVTKREAGYQVVACTAAELRELGYKPSDDGLHGFPWSPPPKK